MTEVKIPTRRGEMPAYLAAVFNLRRPLLSDVRVRRALVMLLDRPGIARTLLTFSVIKLLPLVGA